MEGTLRVASQGLLWCATKRVRATTRSLRVRPSASLPTAAPERDMEEAEAAAGAPWTARRNVLLIARSMDNY